MKNKRFKLPKTIEFHCDINPEDILYAICGLDNDQVFQFIVDLDLTNADWGLTEKLYQHFKKQHEIYLQEESKELGEQY